LTTWKFMETIKLKKLRNETHGSTELKLLTADTWFVTQCNAGNMKQPKLGQWTDIYKAEDKKHNTTLLEQGGRHTSASVKIEARHLHRSTETQRTLAIKRSAKPPTTEKKRRRTNNSSRTSSKTTQRMTTDNWNNEKIKRKMRERQYKRNRRTKTKTKAEVSRIENSSNCNFETSFLFWSCFLEPVSINRNRRKQEWACDLFRITCGRDRMVCRRWSPKCGVCRKSALELLSEREIPFLPVLSSRR